MRKSRITENGDLQHWTKYLEQSKKAIKQSWAGAKNWAGQLLLHNF